MQQKIPSYQEITLSAQDEDIGRLASKIRERRQSLVFNLNAKSKDEIKHLLEALKDELKIKSHLDFLPYPIYFICSDEIRLHPFTIFKSLSELPGFFRREQRRLNSKEASLLGNIQIVFDRVSNLGLQEKFQLFDHYLKKNKLLHDKILENRYLEDLLEGIKKNE